MNINWRNWYLTSAMELEGKLGKRVDAKKMLKLFAPPDMVTEMPVAVTLSAWTSRLKAEKTLDIIQSLGFSFTDSGKLE